MNVDARLSELKLVLPPVPKPNGLYRPVIIVENLVYVSGHAPVREDGSRILGRLGEDFDIEAGKLAARQSGLAIIATLRNELRSLNRVKRLVKVLGLVNATPAFDQHPLVINACSELFVQVFGPENGLGARSTAGMSSLPGNIAVEIEAIFELHPA